jgi:hypothetical protein
MAGVSGGRLGRASGTVGRPCEDGAELLDVVLEMRHEEAIHGHPDRQLAARGVEATSIEVGRREPRAKVLRDREARGDPVEQVADGKLAIAGDSVEPSRVRRHATERCGLSWVLREDEADLGRPVREHLVDVGEDLAGSPVGLRLGAVGRAQRPRLTGNEWAAQIEKLRTCAAQPAGKIIHPRSLARPA